MEDQKSAAAIAAMQKKKIAVMAAVGQIEKDKKNQQQGYGYLSDDAIASAVQAAMVAAGLALTLPEIDDYAEAELQTKSGGSLHVVRIRCRFGLVDSETGVCETGVVYGTGMDSGDKALYKAMTGARKYFFRLAFGIGTGVDGDAETVDRGGAKTTKQSAPPAAPAKQDKPHVPHEFGEIFAGMAIPAAAWHPLASELLANADGNECRALASARDLSASGARWGDGSRTLEEMANAGRAK